VTRVPDLNGEWEGWVQSSYDGEIPEEALHPDNNPTDGQRKMKAKLEIDQTWRKINIHFESRTPSDSYGATILTDEGKWSSINYQYENPGSPLVEGLDMHFGTASLEFRDDGPSDILEGIYYTGPERENYGEMRLEKSE